MDRHTIEKYCGKNIKILLKNGNWYSCRIVSLDNTSLTIVDKFQENITIDFDAISLIKDNRV